MFKMIVTGTERGFLDSFRICVEMLYGQLIIFLFFFLLQDLAGATLYLHVLNIVCYWLLILVFSHRLCLLLNQRRR